MDLNSTWIKAAGPCVIAAVTITAIWTGAYSTNSGAEYSAIEPAKPLSPEIITGAFDTGPVSETVRYADAPMSGGGVDFEAPVVVGVEMDPTYDVATTPLGEDGYVRFLEVGAFRSRAEAENMAAALQNTVADARMGEIAVVFAKHAISDQYRVHVGPFAEGVTSEDVRVFKRRIGFPAAIIVSRAEERVE